jgi:hypothetical protein
LVLFPVLFGVYNLKGIWQRILLFLKNPHFTIIIITGIFLIWLPQFLYWKQQTNQYLYFSYSDNESFFWSQPVILRGLLGFRKGWLIYSPIMIFSVIGIFLCLKKMKEWFFPLITIIPISIYVMLSWWTWWYGGGFGMRPIIDYYGLLAIPFALSISQMWRLKPIFKYAGVFFYLAFFYFGIANHLQAVDGAIHHDSMTWKTYMHNFGHRKMTPEGEKYLEAPDYEMAKQGKNR